MTRVKICGLTSERDLAAAVDAGADAVGFVADVPVDTPREVSVEQATDLAAATPPFASSVLVTMPTAPERAVELAATVDPDILQLHGDVAPGDAAYISASVSATVVAAVSATNVDLARRLDGIVDAVLVDSANDSGAGGTGRTHDWDATRTLARTVDAPVVLAGGLTPENVGDAVRTVQPYAVDVASGVEASPGTKNHRAVEAFVENAREAPRTVQP